MLCQCYFHYGHCDFKKNQSSAKYKNNLTKNDMYLSLANYHVTSIKFVGKCIHMELFESRDEGFAETNIIFNLLLNTTTRQQQ